MNKFSSILLAVSAVIAFSSCGGGTKGVVPAKDTISGPLRDYFKVVDRAYKINDGKINIEIERTNDGLPSPWEEGMEVGYGDNQVEPEFIVEFMDKDGDILCKDETDIVFERDELETVVSLAVGESTSIPFDAKDKNIAKFKVSSTFKYHEPATGMPVKSNNASADDRKSFIEVTGNHVRIRLAPSTEGMILSDSAGKPIFPDKGELIECIGEEGDFYKIHYLGQDAYISKQFTCKVDNDVNEDFGTEDDSQLSDNEARQLLSQYLTLIRKAIDADYHDRDSELERLEKEAEKLEEKLDDLDMTPVLEEIYDKLSDIDTDSDWDEDTYLQAKRKVDELERMLTGNSAGQSDNRNTQSAKQGKTDWDSVLDEYEKYVDSYLSLVKKVSEGDLSALASSASLLEKAQSLNEKLDAAKGDMTEKQLLRLNKISMKMLNAMGENLSD